MNWKTITYDSKLLKGDPMLILSMCVPFILWVLMKYIFPIVAGAVMEWWSFDMGPWYRQAGYFFMLLIPMMTGMVYGFILLDERDGGIITAISVTPAGKPGYLRLRLGIPLLLGFILVVLFIWLLDIGGTNGPVRILLFAALVSTQCLMMLLFLGAFADNKVMGMAIAKGFSILLLGPVLDYILPGSLKWMGSYSPMFWTGRAFLAPAAAGFWFYYAISVVIHALLIALLYRRFMRRSD
jgi:hypothetical protein